MKNYITQNIPVLDLYKSKGIGINIPFNNTTGLNITYNTKDSIRANLLNFLLTGTRERILNTNFGTNIRNQIFEQVDNNQIDEIKQLVFDYINYNFSNILLNNLYITPEDNNISIYFDYSVKNTNINDNIQLILNNV